jgi:putative PEP-CTERM system TPR-repeat lipoprotein
MRTLNTLSKPVASLLFIFTLGVLASCGSGASDAELVESAKGYMAENQIRATAIELKNALQVNPKNAEARYLLAKVNLKAGDMPAAETGFQRALELGWNEEESTLGMLRAMIAQKKYKEVLAHKAETTAWSESGRANYLALEALASVGEGDQLRAKSKYQLAEKIDPLAFDVLKITIFLQATEGRVVDAEATLNKALELFPDNFEFMLMKADFANMNNKDDEAIAIYKRIIDASPKDFMTVNSKKAHLGMLKLATQKGDFERVEKSRKVFEAAKIDEPEVNYYLALAAFMQQQYDQAEEYLQKVLKISSTHGPTLLLSGTVSFAKQDYEKAAYYLSKYVFYDPENTKARKLLGRAYLSLGQNEDARREFKLSLDENTDDAELIALIGLSEISVGEIQAGISDLEKALQMTGDNEALKLQLAKAYVADGETDKAVELLDEILLTHEDKLQIKKIKVLAYLRGNNTAMAMVTAQQMLSESPDDPDVLFLLGTVQLVENDVDSAREYFKRALSASPEHTGSAMNLARIEEKRGEFSSAEKHYLSVLARKPDNVVVMNSMARISVQQGDEEGQVEWLEKAREADSNELYARIALLDIYLEKKNIAESEKLISELERTHADSPALWTAKGRLLMAQKRHTQAGAAFSEYIRARPDSDLGYYLQAKNQLALGDNKAALASSRKAYSLKQDVLRNVILLAEVELSAGNYNRVTQLAEAVIKKAPDSAIGYVLKGDSQQATGNYKQALDSFNKAWANTENRDIALRQFKVTRKLSGVEAAAPILTGWLDKQPGDEGVMLELATAYFIDKQNEKAVTYYEKVLASRPDNITALNNLAWIYGLDNNPRALTLAEKAYTLQPELPSIQDTYGWILLKNDKLSEALTMLKQAAEKLPETPEVQYHYAKALYMSGDKAAARRILKPLIASGKDFGGRIDAEKMLIQ